MKKVIKILILILVGAIVFFGYSLLRLSLIRGSDLRKQKQRLEKLAAAYEAETIALIDESEFVNFSLADPSLHLNEIQMLASHNSYKKRGPALGRFFVALGDTPQEAKAMRYAYHDVTTQLEKGIRSFEFDVRYRKGVFEVTHVPLVDASTTVVDFRLLLEEMKLFSSYQTHLPVIILIEIKDDWMMLDPALEGYSPEVFQQFDILIQEGLGDALFAPSDFVGPSETIKDKITTSGWPLVKDLMNQFIFVLHPGKFNEMYYDNDPTMQSQSLFIGSYDQETYPDYASFFVHNDVNINQIQVLVQAGFIVRTRMDADLFFNQERANDAILSGAQILSTDFSYGRSDLKMNQVLFLDENKTVIKRRGT